MIFAPSYFTGLCRNCNLPKKASVYLVDEAGHWQFGDNHYKYWNDINPPKTKTNIMKKLFKTIQNFLYGTQTNIAPKETKW